MIENYPEKARNLTVNPINLDKSLKLVHEDDNINTWHKLDENIPKRIEMLSKISFTLYNMRNHISFDLITVPIEGTISPRSIIKNVECVLFFGAENNAVYEDRGTIIIRVKQVLKVYENIRIIQTWCKLTPNDSRYRVASTQLSSPLLIKIYNFLNLNYLKDFVSNITSKKVFQEIENLICSGTLVEVDVLITKLLDLVTEYKHIWLHIRGKFY